MTRERVRSAWTAQPFVPFLVHLPDGRSLAVPHPEFLSMSPDNRTIHVWDRRGGGFFVDLFLVSNIEFVRPRRARRSA